MFLEWNLISNQSGGEVPKIADFLGVSKAENETDLIGFNEIHHQSNDTDYLFPITRLVSVHQQQQQQPTAPPPHINLDSSTNFDLQDNSNCLQSLTLSMGSGKPSTCEQTTSTPDNSTSNNNNNNNNTTLDVTPRRTLDTFGQRTSIYRGVTRYVFH